MLSTNRFTMSGATSASSVFGASLMWSWWDLAVYSNIFRNWTDSPEGFSDVLFIVAMLGAGLSLYLFARFASAAMPFLRDKTSQLICAGMLSAIASVTSIFAIQANLLIVEIISATLNGIVLGVLIAIWGCVMTERGAKSAILNSSLAISVGVVTDSIIVFFMQPFQAALLVSLLPLASILIFCMSARKLVDPEVFNRQASTRSISHKSTDMVHREFYGLSLLFILGLTVAEIAFNYMNDQLVGLGSNVADGASFNFLCHVTRGLGALSCFLFVGPLGVTHKRFFWAGGIIMAFSFATLPFWNLLTIPIFIFNYINMACFSIIVIFVFGVLGEISYERKVNPLEPMCFGCIFITAIDIIGVLISMWLKEIVQPDYSTFAAFTCTLGFILVFAVLAVFTEGQRYLDASTGVAAGVRTQTVEEVAAAQAVQECRESLIAAAGLSIRERSVLDELLRGKSPTSIAQELGISENTVKAHMQNTYRKLGVHSKTELLDLMSASTGASVVAITPPPNNDDEPRKKPSFRTAVERLATRNSLTQRETEVFGLLARGYRSNEIQERLSVSSSTVHTHVTSIYTKMGLHSISELTALIQKTREEVDQEG